MNPNPENADVTDVTRYLILILILTPGCSFKPKPYVRDPMGRLPLQTPAAACVEPLTPEWPMPPEPPINL